jgi:hypothetical protein
MYKSWVPSSASQNKNKNKSLVPGGQG